ncbi:MAG TPA: hypothetical protein VF753_06685 [Terriglobales bacterium]
MTRSSATTPADLESLRLRFERWRRTRKSKTRIPDGLWSAAVELARRYGINRTAAPLRLDGGKLKRLVLAAGRGSRRPAAPKFVELVASAGASLSNMAEYTLELEGHDRKLRIQCKGASATELAALSRALWSLDR